MAALPLATVTVSALPLTVTGVASGAARAPLACTLWPPMVIALVARRSGLTAARAAGLPRR